jgi:Ca2+-binding EF-hand superfamily protein
MNTGDFTMKSIPMTALAVALLASTSAFANEGFKQADANADGVLSMEEVSTIAPDTTEAQFKAADADGDGMLSEVEFAAAVTPATNGTTNQ